MNLDHILLNFTKNDPWTIRDAVRGVQIFGGIGSGKSSGSGKAIAKTYLKNGFGGLVLCAKPDEKENWVQLAKEANREKDLIIFEKGSSYQFNPLQYELTREGEGAGETLNLSNLFMAIYKMSNRLSGGGSSGESERFWDNALKRCLNRMIQLLRLASKELSVANMRRLISSVPMDYEVQKIHNKELSDQQILKWSETNYCLECILDAGENVQDDDEEEENHEYDMINDYFLREFPALGERTRPLIVESFLGIAEPFTTGILKTHFANQTNLYPEETHNGKIIILNFPVKEFLDAGIYSQGIYKLLWQQATERRDINKNPLPVFLWVDESQYFISDYDQIFQTTARSSRACTVFISQNISNYYSAIGGSDPRPKVDSLLGNLGTKIFHANNDAVTNQWAADTIGKAFLDVSGITIGQSQSTSLNKQLNYLVEPREFTTYKSGGVLNDFHVEAVVTVAGKKFNNGQNFRKVTFIQ